MTHPAQPCSMVRSGPTGRVMNDLYQKGMQHLHRELSHRAMSVMQAIPIQPGMQGMQPMMPPYAMELANAASAAGYWADRLSTDEQQRSYLVMQQVRRAALEGPHFWFLVHLHLAAVCPHVSVLEPYCDTITLFLAHVKQSDACCGRGRRTCACQIWCSSIIHSTL